MWDILPEKYGECEKQGPVGTHSNKALHFRPEAKSACTGLKTDLLGNDNQDRLDRSLDRRSFLIEFSIVRPILVKNTGGTTAIQPHGFDCASCFQ